MKKTIQLIIILIAFLFPLLTITITNQETLAQTNIIDYPGNFDDNLRLMQNLDGVVNSNGQLWYETIPNCLCVEPDFRDENWSSLYNPWLDYYHPGADDEFRSTRQDIFTSADTDNQIVIQPRQQCTYKEDRLITQGSAAGTPDRFPQATDNHTNQDVIPFEVLGWRIYNRFNPPNQGILDACPNNSLTPITLNVNAPIESGIFQGVLRLPDAQVGMPYEVRINVTNVLDDDSTHEFSIEDYLPLSLTTIQRGMLPPGLSVDSNTGIVSGTPTLPSGEIDGPDDLTFMFTVFAEDDDGRTGSQAFEIIVNNGAEIIVNPETEQATSDLTNNNLLDLIFVIDTTGSMFDDIDAVKQQAREIIENVASGGSNWRIALVVYRDHPPPYGMENDAYISRVELDFSTDRDQIIDRLNGITIRQGAGDAAEAMFSGLMDAINLNWRNGAKKAIIVMGDAPPHNPEPFTGYTMDSVLQAAFNVDPANIYPLLIASDPRIREFTVQAFQQLADGSSGRLFFAETADQVVDSISSTIGSINYQPVLSEILDPGDQARVFVTGGDTLNVREGPGTSFSRVDRLRIGDIVTIIDGPIYADTYLWWNLETPNGTEGWAVEAADGIVTLAPLSFEGVSSYIPPEDRSVTPDNAILLSGGRGLTNGVLMNPGEFQVEWYCNNQGYGVGEDGTDWYCTGGFTLQISDFDAICQATYNYASAFAVQDGSNGAPAYNWRCYGPR